MLIHIWGEYGLYTRPEFAADRVSYPVPPFSTLTGLLEAFYWKRDVTWYIERVYVLSQVRYVQVMRNERMVEEGSVRTQRRSLYVKRPSYVVQARPQSPDFAQENKAVAMAYRWLHHGRTRQGPLPRREGVRRVHRPAAAELRGARVEDQPRHAAARQHASERAVR